MDGFHRRQEYLLSHTTTRDGKKIRMVEIKGAPITFDLDAFRQRIAQGLRGGSVSWPAYDRHLHNPVEGAITVQRDIVLLEGNYLLLDEEGWRDLRDLADLTIFIKADEDMLRERLIDRKAKSGNSNEEAAKFVDYSDMANVRICLQNSLSPDIMLWLDGDGEYHLTA
jgi:pantothenate kinase